MRPNRNIPEYFEGTLSADIAAGRAVRDLCRKTMRFDTSPSSVLSAYMLLAKNQYDCLTTLVEGVRYSIGGEKNNTTSSHLI